MLAASCFRAMQAARKGCGLPACSFDDLDEPVQYAFPQVVGEIERHFSDLEEAGLDVSVSEMARRYAGRFVELCGGESGHEPDYPALLVFESLVRHVANGMDYDADDHGDMGDHEESWQEWVRHRLEAAGAVSSNTGD